MKSAALLLFSYISRGHNPILLMIHEPESSIMELLFAVSTLPHFFVLFWPL